MTILYLKYVGKRVKHDTLETCYGCRGCLSFNFESYGIIAVRSIRRPHNIIRDTKIIITSAYTFNISRGIMFANVVDYGLEYANKRYRQNYKFLYIVSHRLVSYVTRSHM